MKYFLAIILCTMLVGVVLSGTCSDTCKTPCHVAKQACRFLSNADALCDTEFIVCTGACDTACACDDQCDAECTSGLSSCRAGNVNDLVGLADCDIAFQICFVDCVEDCVDDIEAGLLHGDA